MHISKPRKLIGIYSEAVGWILLLFPLLVEADHYLIDLAIPIIGLIVVLTARRIRGDS